MATSCRFWTPDKEIHFAGGIDNLAFGPLQEVKLDRTYQSDLWMASAAIVGLDP
jgi:hypothetical protein